MHMYIRLIMGTRIAMDMYYIIASFYIRVRMRLDIAWLYNLAEKFVREGDCTGISPVLLVSLLGTITHGTK